MSMITSYAIFLAAAVTAASASASAGTDPAAPCRAAYADDPPAHIACLESALREQSGAEAPTETATDQPSGLGSDQLIQKERTKADAPAEQATFLIVAATYDARGLGVFRLENGQVWREIEISPRQKRLQPDQQYQARIERAKIGSFRMYVDGIRWMFKIERLK